MYGTFLENTNTTDDTYGFVNENEIRLATFFALILAVYSFTSVVVFGLFTLPIFFIGIIWLDFLLKVIWGPEKSIFGNIAAKCITKKNWVGAVQKRFAWSIGLFLSTFAFLCILIISGFLPSYGVCTPVFEAYNELSTPSYLAVPITAPIVACALCIIFMTLESVFGYCVGCKIYAQLVQWKWMKMIPNQNCPGGICKL